MHLSSTSPPTTGRVRPSASPKSSSRPHRDGLRVQEPIIWHRLTPSTVRTLRLADVWQIGPETESRLIEAGIPDLQTLSTSDPRRVAQALGWSHVRKARYFVAHAQALLTGSPVIVEAPPLPPSPRRYLDIETDTAHRYCWLISVAEEHGEPVQWFSQNGPAGEKRILKQLVEWLDAGPELPVLFYGGPESRMLPERLTAHRLPLPRPLRQATDPYIECFARLRIALPVPARDLKSVAKAIGYAIRHPDLDGFLVAHRYEKWVQGDRNVDIRQLLEYGQDDVLALRALIQWIDDLLRNRDASAL